MFIWMGLIFSMSAKPAEESSKMSNSVGFTIGKIFISNFDDMSYDDQFEIVENMDHGVRKTAHAVEYMILGVFCIIWIYDKDKKILYQIFLALLICALYATTDEIHQMFVPGRACRFTDVLIDSSGAITGIVIMYFLLGFIMKKKKSQNLKNATNK